MIAVLTAFEQVESWEDGEFSPRDAKANAEASYLIADAMLAARQR